VDIEAPPARSREALAALGFAFFFAPAYHPAFRNIAPVRKALAARGRRTVFNILGPLVNPGRPAHVLLGVYAASWVPTLASALEALGAKAGLAVHGSISPERGIDELTTATTNRVRGFGALRGVSADWVAADFNLPAAPFSDLAGGGVADNVRLVDSLLAGRGPAGLADTIALNASVAMWICGRTPEPGAGIGRARDLLLGGAVRDKIAAAKEFYGKR
jgi:anthranilate phosphoribosyltransferase